jgi:hypothetical protein
MAKYTYSDVVRVEAGVKHWVNVPGSRKPGPRIGEPASVYAVDDELSAYWKTKYPAGAVYGVEYEDGDSVEIHESDLELVEQPK